MFAQQTRLYPMTCMQRLQSVGFLKISNCLGRMVTLFTVFNQTTQANSASRPMVRYRSTLCAYPMPSLTTTRAKMQPADIPPLQSATPCLHVQPVS